METSKYQRAFTPDRIKDLEPNEVFVFGSNRQGYHGGGAARELPRLSLEPYGAKELVFMDKATPFQLWMEA